jgi:outer membrane protein assembly factor BamB
LYALNAELTNYWQFSLGSVSTPTVGDDGQIFVWVANSRFYALDSNGVPAWWFAGKYDLHLPAAVAGDGTLIIADGNQTVSCFDPVTQSFRWQYASGSPISAAPAVGVDGTVFLGSQDGQLHALNADGSLRWRFRTGGQIQSSPAVGSDGVVYFGSDDRGIYAVGPDGRRLWAAQARGVVSASPVIAPDGTVIVGSRDGRLYAFSPEGTERWEYAANGAIYGSACVGSDGTVYFGTYNGWVYALNRDGQPMWSFNSATNGLSGHVIDSPLLIEDRLLVPISSAGLQALAVSAGPAEVNWPQYRHDVQRTARAHSWLSMTLPDTSGKIAGEDLPVTVGLTFAGHTIARLDLLCGTNVLATITGPGPVITWSPIIGGSYFLCVRAVDDAGNVHLSAPCLVDIAPPPWLTISKPPSNNAQLSFNTVAGRSYQVQRSTDLRNWISIDQPVTATNSHQEWADPSAPSTTAYYRVQLLP